MRRPRLNALRTFEAAGRRLSFSLAAAELNITQAAVSQQIRTLEAHLGAPLFLRPHRRVSLTVKGREYLDAVQEALNRLDSASDRLFGTRPNQVVTIRCSTSVATLWLAPEIGAFQTRNPDIDLHILTHEQAREANLSTGAELEIFASAIPGHAPDVRALLTCAVTPVAAPGYVRTRPPECAGDILNFNLIHVLGYDEGWHTWLKTYHPGAQGVPRGLSVDSSLFAIDAALRGDGVFLGRRPFIDAYLDCRKLVEVFTEPHHLSAGYYLRRNSNGHDNRNTDRVAGWLRELAG